MIKTSQTVEDWKPFHSSTSHLNLSRFWHMYITESFHAEPKSGGVEAPECWHTMVYAPFVPDAERAHYESLAQTDLNNTAWLCLLTHIEGDRRASVYEEAPGCRHAPCG